MRQSSRFLGFALFVGASVCLAASMGCATGATYRGLEAEMPREGPAEEVVWVVRSVNGTESIYRCTAPAPDEDAPVCIRARRYAPNGAGAMAERIEE